MAQDVLDVVGKGFEQPENEKACHKPEKMLYINPGSKISMP